MEFAGPRQRGRCFSQDREGGGGGRRSFNRESGFCLLWLPGTKPISTPTHQWDESRKQEMWQNGTGRRRRELRARAFWFLQRWMLKTERRLNGEGKACFAHPLDSGCVCDGLRVRRGSILSACVYIPFPAAWPSMAALCMCCLTQGNKQSCHANNDPCPTCLTGLLMNQNKIIAPWLSVKCKWI